MKTNLDAKVIKDFLWYFNEFYGPNGFYPLGIAYSESDIIHGIACISLGEGMNFEGDTVDRERVANHLLEWDRLINSK